MNSDVNVIIGVIYRPPDNDINVFTQKLINVLNSIHKEKKTCYLMGDFNINLLNSNIHNPTCEFVDTLYEYNFFPLINKPTRVTKVSATLIDNIFTNNIKHKGILSSILYTDITDHFPICHILNNNVQHGSSIITK